MALLDFLSPKKEPAAPIAPVLPNDIYAQGTLDLADTIAPAALKVGSKELEIGEKFRARFTPFHIHDSFRMRGLCLS
jgi:hypothetical protein